MTTTLGEKHIQLVEAVNNASTVTERTVALLELTWWRKGVKDALGSDDAQEGHFLMQADCFYLDQGLDLPTCGGIRLDWSPK